MPSENRRRHDSTEVKHTTPDYRLFDGSGIFGDS